MEFGYQTTKKNEGYNLNELQNIQKPSIFEIEFCINEGVFLTKGFNEFTLGIFYKEITQMFNEIHKITSKEGLKYNKVRDFCHILLCVSSILTWTLPIMACYACSLDNKWNNITSKVNDIVCSYNSKLKEKGMMIELYTIKIGLAVQCGKPDVPLSILFTLRL